MATLDDLARELGLLRSRAARGSRSAKVSLEELAGRVDEPRSTIHAYLSGRRLAPSQVLDRIVIALGTTPAEQREWAEAWYRVSAYRDSAHRGPATGNGRDDAVPRQLPLTADNFTGRVEQLAELDELLADGRSGVIAAVSGTAGVGKTALAVQWAYSRAERFPDGQLYVDLRGFDPDQPMQPSQALARFLRALGVPGTDIPRELGERAALYRSLLSGRRMLILLDNARDVEQVRSLLPGSSSCSVLVTSRDSLTGLIARHGGHRVELRAFPLADAVSLLRALVGRHVDGGPDEFGGLAEQCARLPLALRIAAELAVSRSGASLTALIRELSPAGRRLDLLDAGEDPRTAIRSVFSWSYLRLAAPVAQVFRLIGQSPAADLTPAAVAALTELTELEAQRMLGLLARAHLIREDRPGRYGMHDLLRAYATELAVATDTGPERRLALTRLFDHYLHTAGQAMELLFPGRRHRRPELPVASVGTVALPDRAAARDWLDGERVNLLAVAGQAGRKGWPQHAIGLAQTVALYLDSSGYYADALAMHGCAVAAARACEDQLAEATGLNNLGIAHTRLAQQDGIDCFQRALSLYLELGDRGGQGRVLSNLGQVYRQLGRLPEALDHDRQHLVIDHGNDDLADGTTAFGDELGELRPGLPSPIAQRNHSQDR